MVEISMSGSGEGPGRVTDRGYSTMQCRWVGLGATMKRCNGESRLLHRCFYCTCVHYSRPDQDWPKKEGACIPAGCGLATPFASKSSLIKTLSFLAFIMNSLGALGR
jgi:hypothetical protein